MLEEVKYPDFDKFMYFGYKFETLSTGGGFDAMVDASSEFTTVVETRIDQKRCAIAAEIDCYDLQIANEKGKASLDAFIELKTARFATTEKQRINSQRYKYPKWWFQSFIAGVPKIHVGHWTSNGILREVSSLPVRELPVLAQNRMNNRLRNQVRRKFSRFDGCVF